MKALNTVISQPICNTCTASANMNNISGYCEQCKTDCQTCVVQSVKAFCGACTPEIATRSASIDGDNCIACPTHCVGCRYRSQAEITSFNSFFNPDSKELQVYSQICFDCTNDPTVYFNANLGRC